MMMKFVQYCRRPNLWGKLESITSERGIRVLEMRPLTTSSKVTKEETLFSRLVPHKNPKISMLPILDQWVEEQRPIDLADIRRIIKQFRKYRRLKHALQISQWMTGKSSLDLSSSDAAVQLDLIAKVHGVDQAEEYFNSIPEGSTKFPVYDALLHCYADAKRVEKAEAIMQKMRELGCARTLTYNNMMNLYSKTGKHDRIDSLVQEMEEKLIKCDQFTYTIRLNAYAVALDMDGMEKLLTKMKTDPSIKMDWHAYVSVSKGYIRAGDMEKALATLKKSEKLIHVRKRKLAYEILMTLYASVGSKDEMYRIWDLCKKNEKFSNVTYVCAISSLAKLDDLDGAQKLWEEWEANRISYDFRVPNMIIASYCKKGLTERAESIVQRLIDSGNDPNSTTWTSMALGYLKNNQMEKAVESLNKSLTVGEPGWKPPNDVVTACLEYLNEKGDSDMIEHIETSLASRGLDSMDVGEKLATDGQGEMADEGPDVIASDWTERDEEAV